MAKEQREEISAITSSVFHATVASFSHSINQYLVRSTQSTLLRGVYILYGVSLALGCYRHTPNWKTLKVILLNVISFVVVSFVTDVLTIQGVDSAALSVVTSLILLTGVQTVTKNWKHTEEVAEVLDTLTSNSQYVFTHTLTLLMTRVSNPFISVVAATSLLAIQHILGMHDPVAVNVISAASIGVVKTILLASIPLALKLPTHIILLGFLNPFVNRGGMQTAYTLVLYTSGQTVAEAVQAEFSPVVSVLLTTVVALMAQYTALQELATVTATVLVTNLALQGIDRNSHADPLLTLLLAGLGVKLVLNLTQKRKW